MHRLGEKYENWYFKVTNEFRRICALKLLLSHKLNGRQVSKTIKHFWGTVASDVMHVIYEMLGCICLRWSTDYELVHHGRLRISDLENGKNYLKVN